MANPANLIPTLTFKSWLSNGTPNALGTVQTYSAGTTIPIATWTDWTAQQVLPNPIPLNSRGEADIYLLPNVGYKFIEFDAAGNQINITDQVFNTQLITLYGGVDSGIANAYVLNFTAPFTSYQTGIVIYWQASNTNTGPSTLNVNGLGVAPIINPNGSALTAGQIVGGTIVTVIMVNGSWQLLNFTSGVGLGLFGTETAIASAATTDLGTAIAHVVNVTGSATISSFGSSAQLTAPIYMVRFTGNPFIQNNANIITQSGFNIQTQSGDAMLIEYLGGGLWQILLYQSGSFPITVVKSNSTSRASVTSPSADPDLQVTLSSPGTYIIEGWINDLGGTSAGGLIAEIAFTGTFNRGSWAVDGVGTGFTAVPLTNVNTAAQMESAQSGLASMNLNGFIQTSGSGLLSFSWAQNTSNGTASIVSPGSWLRVSRVSAFTSSFVPVTHTYTSGTGTETIPSGATTMVIEAWGGSGPGGAGSSYFTAHQIQYSGGGGGGAAGYCRSSFPVTGLTGETMTYIVGSAGGGNTSITAGTFAMTTMAANGGGGGGNASGFTGGTLGTGGTASGGTSANATGSNGTAGSAGSFGTGGVGTVGINGTGARGGNGGYATMPLGGGGPGQITFRYT